MRLSDAIILGSTLHKQAFGVLRIRDWDDTIKTCALGAALEAISDHTPQESVYKHWPWLQSGAICCAECNDGLQRDASGFIPHLNDIHRLTREEIAAWVATVEPKEQIQEGAPKKNTIAVIEVAC